MSSSFDAIGFFNIAYYLLISYYQTSLAVMYKMIFKWLTCRQTNEVGSGPGKWTPARESGTVFVFALKWWDFMRKEGRRTCMRCDGEQKVLIWFWSLKSIQTVFDWAICAVARSKKKWAQKEVNTISLSFVAGSFFVVGYFFSDKGVYTIDTDWKHNTIRLPVSLKSIAWKCLPLGISLNESQKLETPDLP